jgi:hypothetical protein
MKLLDVIDKIKNQNIFIKCTIALVVSIVLVKLMTIVINVPMIIEYVLYQKWKISHGQEKLVFHELTIKLPEKWWVSKEKDNYIQFARVRNWDHEDPYFVGISKDQEPQKSLENRADKVEVKGEILIKMGPVEIEKIWGRESQLLKYKYEQPKSLGNYKDKDLIISYRRIPSICINISSKSDPETEHYLIELFKNISIQ